MDPTGGSTSPAAPWHLDPDGGPPTPERTYTPGATAAADPYPLTGRTSDAFAVVATDAAGRTFTLPAVTAGVRPLSPADLAVADATADSVTLRWQVRSNLADAYEVYRADGAAGGTDYEPVARADAAAGTMTYVGATVTPDQTYRYEVRAMTDAAAVPGLSEPATLPSPAGGRPGGSWPAAPAARRRS